MRRRMVPQPQGFGGSMGQRPPLRQTPSWRLQIHHINVGQGDSTLIHIEKTQNGSKTAVLIDGGEQNKGSDVADYLATNFPFIKIKYLICSHTHTDHQPGLIWLVRNRPGFFDGNSRYMDRTGMYKITTGNVEQNFTDQEVIPLRTDLLQLGNGAPRLTCIGFNLATAHYLEPADGQYENGNSMMFLVEFNNFTYYTAGDQDKYEIWDRRYRMPFRDSSDHPYNTALGRLISYLRGFNKSKLDKYLRANAEKYFYDPPVLPKKIDAFKVSHHGCDNATSGFFLDMIKPRVGFISVGDRYGTNATTSSFNHPRVGVLRNLDDRNISYYTTNMVEKTYACTLKHFASDPPVYSDTDYKCLWKYFIDCPMEGDFLFEPIPVALKCWHGDRDLDVVYNYLNIEKLFNYHNYGNKDEVWLLPELFWRIWWGNGDSVKLGTDSVGAARNPAAFNVQTVYGNTTYR